MDPIKSIAVPVKRREAVAKAKRAGRPTPPPDSRVGGAVGEHRRQPPAIAERPAHRFRIGQRLAMARGSRDIARAPSFCHVTAVLPHESGPLLYRVRSELESFERVVEEADLTLVR